MLTSQNSENTTHAHHVKQVETSGVACVASVSARVRCESSNESEKKKRRGRGRERGRGRGGEGREGKETLEGKPYDLKKIPLNQQRSV